MSQEFDYMLLARLQSDCESFLSWGGALWGVTADVHMDKMYELWEGLKIKPEWLTAKELTDLNLKMIHQERETK